MIVIIFQIILHEIVLVRELLVQAEVLVTGNGLYAMHAWRFDSQVHLSDHIQINFYYFVQSSKV